MRAKEQRRCKDELACSGYLKPMRLQAMGSVDECYRGWLMSAIGVGLVQVSVVGVGVGECERRSYGGVKTNSSLVCIDDLKNMIIKLIRIFSFATFIWDAYVKQ